MLYIGVTGDLKQRIVDHKEGKASVFTKKYNIHYLMLFEEFTDINKAIAREKQLKNWHKDWKWNHILQSNPNREELQIF